MTGDGAQDGADDDAQGIRMSPRSKSDSWQPLCQWPPMTYVQWGRSGLVLSSKGNYQTAFFEAFVENDPDVDFIRGEGETLVAAEEQAWRRYLKAKECEHRWGRRGYLNGVGVCLRCGYSKSSVFGTIKDLGAWRAPLSSMELSSIRMGDVKDEPVPGEVRYITRLRLRARIAGIELPSHKKLSQGMTKRDGDEAYGDACEDVIAAWLQKNGLPPRNGAGGLDGFFDGAARSGLEGLLPEKE